jgi:hypothetical protein
LSYNNIVILPNKEDSLINEIKKYNLKNIYFANDLFNLTIDNSYKNLYYYAKIAHYSDVAIYFDTGINFIYINDEFINDYKNNKNISLKLHCTNTGKYYSSLNLYQNILQNYVNFIPIYNIYI